MRTPPDMVVDRAPLESPSVGILVLARDGSVLDADAVAQRLLGKGPGAAGIQGRSLLACVEDPDRQAVRRLLDEAFRGVAGAVEVSLRGADGESRRVQAHASPLRGETGAVRAVQATVHDVTDRWRSEAALAESAREFRTLAENVPDNVVLYDRQCRVAYLNPAMRASVAADIVPTLGTAPAERAPGVPWVEQYQRLLQRVLATGRPAEMEAPVRGPTGDLRTHHILFAAARTGRGEIVGVIAIGRDVTERKRTEEALRKLSLAVEQSPASIIITDTAGRIEYVNTKFTEATGYSSAEVLGQNPRLLKSGETRPEQYRELWAAVSSGKVWRGEFHNRRKDGELYWELASVSPVCDADGRITHYLAVKEDITERRRLEERLRQAQKLDAIGRLAGGVAHDFNNLLTVIQGGAAALREGGHGQDEGEELLDQISEAAERAARLTRQLLTFSHRRAARLAALDLNDVVRSTSRMLGRIIGEQITLVEQCAPEGAPVHADQGMMEQVLLNLAVNARDAMPAGGRLSIRTEVVVAPAGPGPSAPRRQVLLTVGDTGNGIAPEHRAHLFEPFFTTKEVGKGTGLGLAVVFGIVEQHGGRIEVESEVGAGTTFRISLPLLEAAPEPAPAPRPPVRPRGGTETVLVVEDELSLQRMVRRVLERNGYRVHVAGSAAAALEIWAEHRGEIDLLLTDLVMPGMGGRELGERLRADQPSLRIVYTTGYSRESLGDAATLRAVLEKPYRPEEVLAKVRACLDEG